MKILYFFAQYEGAMYHWQDTHIIDELNHHGIDVELFNPLFYESIDQANETARRTIDTKSFDLFMTCNDDSICYSSTVDYIRQKGIPCLLINFDNKMQPRKDLAFSEHFDLLMLLNVDDNPVYKKLKCPYFFAPYAANPFFFKDLRDNAHNGICFVGTPYGTRCKPINTILAAGLPFDLYANQKNIEEQRKIAIGMSFHQQLSAFGEMIDSSSGRKVIASALISKIKKPEVLDSCSKYLSIHDAVSLDEMNTLYSNYSLSLSMPEARNTGILKRPVDIVRLRNFEIPMCAGLQITRYYYELSQYFEENKEILFYRTDEELVDKVRFYTDSKHQSEVDEMKKNARRRAESEHTWFRRFLTAFEKLGLT